MVLESYSQLYTKIRDNMKIPYKFNVTAKCLNNFKLIPKNNYPKFFLKCLRGSL